MRLNRMNSEALVKKTTKIMFSDAGVSGTAQYISQLVWILFLKVFDYKEEEWELEDDYVPVIPKPFRFRDWANPKNANGTRDIKNRLTGDKLIDFVNNRLFPFLRGDVVEMDGKEYTFLSDDPKSYIVREFMRESVNYMKDGVNLRQVIDEIGEIDFDNAGEKHEFNEFYEKLLKELQNGGKATGEFYTPRAVTKFVTDHVNPQIGETVADFACGTAGFLVEAVCHLQEQANTIEDNELIQKSIYGIEWKQLPYMLGITNLLLHNINNPNILHGDGLSKNVLDLCDNDLYDCILMNPPFGGVVSEVDKGNFPNDLVSGESADLFVARILYCLKKNGRCGLVLPDGLLFQNDSTKIALKKKLLTECNLHTIIRLPNTVFSPYTDITTNLLFFDRTGKTKEVWFYRMDMPKGKKHFNKTNPIKREDMEDIDVWWNNRIEIKDKKEDESMTETWKARKYSFEELEENGFNLDLCGYPEKEEIILSPEETIKNYISIKSKLEHQLAEATGNLEKYIEGNIDIKLFDIKSISKQILEIDTAFPSDMKKSVLQAMVQGKLTEQQISDTNISDFLKKNGITLYTGDYPYDIPDSWVFVRLEDLVCYPIKRGKSPTYTNKSSTYVFAQKCNLKYGEISLKEAKFLDETVLSKYQEEDYLKNEDIVINSTGTGTLGRVKMFYSSVIPEGMDIVPDSHVTVVRIKEGFNRQYIYQIIKKYQPYLETKGVGSTKQKELKPDIIKNLLIPMPPVEEQDRIVEKVSAIIPLLEGNND